MTFQTAHIKNKVFEPENELRAVSFLPDGNQLYEFERNGKKIKCYDQHFNIDSIKEIIIGPSPIQSETFKIVQEIINTYKINCALSKSVIPLIL